MPTPATRTEKGAASVDDTWPYDDEDDGPSDLASVLDFSAPQDFPATDDDVASDYAAAVADEHGEQPAEHPLFAVSNPPGTVTVTTGLDGRVRKIELASRTGDLTESTLADEIVVLAKLATGDARAAQYAFMLDGMREQGHDAAATRDFLERDLELPSPEQATAARAAVFAQRYAAGDDD
jgi:hypothetical protein